MIETQAPAERAYLVALDRPRSRFDPDDSLEELASLVQASGTDVVGKTVQRRRAPDANTWMGKGKVAELGTAMKAAKADLLVTDDELTPQQQRGLEAALGIRVVDRSAVILDIFARHAQTKEGRVQVELAQLEYLRPRLRGIWKGLSRLGGGIGTRGPGESLLETDRRVVERRLIDLKARLDEVGKQRERSRRSRGREGLYLAALVGYTNAGKSTLMNALTDAGALVAGQPFATLDPRTRRLSLPGGRHATLSDTVGFVRKLPHELIEAFKSTLEEVARADLVLHVADASAPDLEEQMASVREVLGEIGAGALPEVLALNKWDLLDGAGRARLARRLPDGVPVSALLGEGVQDVRRSAAEALPHPPLDVRLLIPYDRPEILPSLYRRAEVLGVHDEQHGQLVEARVSPADLAVVGEFILDGR